MLLVCHYAGFLEKFSINDSSLLVQIVRYEYGDTTVVELYT